MTMLSDMTAAHDSSTTVLSTNAGTSGNATGVDGPTATNGHIAGT